MCAYRAAVVKREQRGRRDHWESAFQKKRKSASKRAIGDFSENNYYLLGPVAFSPSHGVVLAAPSASNAGAEFLLTVSSPRIYLVRVTQAAVKKYKTAPAYLGRLELSPSRLSLSPSAVLN